MQQQPMASYIPTAGGAPGAAPVQSVAYPTGQAPQASAQQQWQQRMVAIARPLEQTIPSYQILASILQDMMSAQAEDAAGITAAYCDASVALNATLGAVRRFLTGEASQAVLMALATSINRFAKAQSVLRPQIERLIMGIPAEMRTSLSQFTQNFANAENLVNQAGSIVQSTVGPQVWETVRAQVWEAAAPQGAPVPMPTPMAQPTPTAQPAPTAQPTPTAQPQWWQTPAQQPWQMPTPQQGQAPWSQQGVTGWQAPQFNWPEVTRTPAPQPEQPQPEQPPQPEAPPRTEQPPADGGKQA